ncbi:MAG: hypothetical protein H7Z14_08295, partial [Anaerolineae bacterium]|nr:hypothetical protein [Phycisphaerae bacterium]
GGARFNASPATPFELDCVGTGIFTGSADITLGGDSSILSARFYQAGKTIIAPGATVEFGKVTLSEDTSFQSTIENHGLLRVMGTNAGDTLLQFYGQASVKNMPGGRLEVGGAQFLFTSNSTSTIENAGTLAIVSRNATIGIPLNNTGTVHIGTAGLFLQRGGVSSGTVQFASAQSYLEFNASYAFAAGATASGDGFWRMVNGTFDMRELSLAVTGRVAIENSIATFAAMAAPGANWYISNTTAAFGGAQSFAAGTLQGTINLTAANDLTLTGPFTWSSGTINAPGGTLHVNPGATLTTDSSNTLTLNGSLQNAGTIAINGGKIRLISAESTIKNLAGGTIQLVGGTFEKGTATPMTLTNAGTLVRTASPTELILANFAIDNTGTIDAQGRLTFSSCSAHTQSGGSVNVGIVGWLDWIGNTNWTFDAGSTFTSAGTFRVLDGQHDFYGDALFPSGIAVLNGGHVNMASAGAKSFSNLLVQLNGRLSLAPGGDKLLKLATFFVGDAGAIDLNDNGLLLDYTGASPGAFVQSRINTARAGGAWTGSGITSSAAKNANPKNTTLGVLEASEFKSIYGPSAMFAGETIDSTAVLVKYTYYGDVDFNGVVDFDDYSRIDAGFTNHRTGWLNGDVDGNGIVDFDD